MKESAAYPVPFSQFVLNEQLVTWHGKMWVVNGLDICGSRMTSISRVANNYTRFNTISIYIYISPNVGKTAVR